MRGTGCSGGAFDYFEPLQGLDGYDVVETVARQPWVKGKPGMVGLSYGGISQLFVAATKPPSLAAIAPLSVIDNTATTLYPGGILNTGFALSWAKDRVHDAKPASATGGQPWALKRIREGDKTCKANQALHPEAVDLLAKIERNRFYVPEVADPLAPVTFVHRIRVPTFLACQWTDEQTGGHCPTLASRFTGTDRKWFTFTNGTHVDSLDPATFNRWFDFLELYVAGRAPRLPPGTANLAPLIYQTILGVPGVGLPADPIQASPTFEAARTAFEAQPRVRVAFDNGAVSAGKPGAAFERSYPRWPVPGTVARSFYLGAGGTLADAKQPGGQDRFTWSPRARPATDFAGDTGAGTNGLWTATPSYDWRPNPAGTALVVHDRPADRRHDGRRRAARCAPGSARPRRTSTSRPRSPRSGPTGRRPSSRAAGCARAPASSTPPRARCSSRSSACASATASRSRAGSSRASTSRSTTRATSTGRARGSASSSRRPAATSRSGRSRGRTRGAARRRSGSPAAGAIPRG